MSPNRDLILIVDDTDANRYVIVRLLTRAGYDVIEATSLAAAEEMLGHKPDLVVCDVNLPDGNGTTFARRIKADAKTASIMVLNMSASYTRTKDRVVGLENGADSYLSQPLDPNEFLATVKALLRIRHAESAARQKHEELELVMHGISHDLKEPLRMVISFLDLIDLPERTTLDEKQKKYLGFARSASVRMRSMINDLISVTMVDQKGLELSEVSPKEVIDESMSNLLMMVEQFRPDLMVAPLPKVRADRGLLMQVFQNILSNCMKYHANRPLSIRITASTNEGMVVISIQDNGVGIPSGSLTSIFAAFKRLHSQDAIPGTGIGLALCKKIVEMHGGKIGCASEVGVGTTFWFSLPMAS